MIRIYKAEGIVLARRNTGEADRLVTVFTKQYGKKVLKAAGVRRINSRRSPHLELFTHLDLIIHPGKAWDIVSEVAPIERFPYIRIRLERIGFAYIVLELVNRILAENQEALTVYISLVRFLHRLNDATLTRHEAGQELVAFKQYLLSELGFVSGEHPAVRLDRTIEDILESRLKSPVLLTRIQSHI